MGHEPKNCVCTKRTMALFVAVTSTVICLAAFIMYILPTIILPGLNWTVKFFYVVTAILYILRFFNGCGLIHDIIKKKNIFITCWIALTWCHGVLLLSCSLVGIIIIIATHEETFIYHIISAMYTVYGLLLIVIAKNMTAYVNTLPNTKQQGRSAKKDVEGMLMRGEDDNNNEESVQHGDDDIPMNNGQQVSNSIPAEAA